MTTQSSYDIFPQLFNCFEAERSWFFLKICLLSTSQKQWICYIRIMSRAFDFWSMEYFVSFSKIWCFIETPLQLCCYDVFLWIAFFFIIWKCGKPCVWSFGASIKKPYSKFFRNLGVTIISSKFALFWYGENPFEKHTLKI